MRAHIASDRRQDAEESNFCSTVKNLLEHGIDVRYIQPALDGDSDFADEQREIYLDWVMVALSRAGAGAAALRANAV